tara:strand:- start:491 stop:766 length:276 start_codon:yes stop_codon:yes gene_type:complete
MEVTNKAFQCSEQFRCSRDEINVTTTWDNMLVIEHGLVTVELVNLRVLIGMSKDPEDRLSPPGSWRATTLWLRMTARTPTIGKRGSLADVA